MSPTITRANDLDAVSDQRLAHLYTTKSFTYNVNGQLA